MSLFVSLAKWSVGWLVGWLIEYVFCLLFALLRFTFVRGLWGCGLEDSGIPCKYRRDILLITDAWFSRQRYLSPVLAYAILFYDSHGTCGEYPQPGSLCCFSRRTAMTALWKAFRLERGKHGDSSSSPSSAAPTPLHPPSLLVGPVSVYCDWAR